MTQVKVADLTGAALDWAVATAEGWKSEPDASRPRDTWLWRKHETAWLSEWAYSTKWMRGGPIIDREDITVGPWDTSPAMAHMPGPITSVNPRWVGKTKLIAAMRCYVAYKNRRRGEPAETIDIPQELL